jgi:hypothetical protein
VLDAFAEEILAAEDTEDWRSGVLNPVLIRAYHQADDFDQKQIIERMKATTQLSGRITNEHWIGFYHNLDVLAPNYCLQWNDVKDVYITTQDAAEDIEGYLFSQPL